MVGKNDDIGCMAWLVCENQGGVSLLAVKQETWGAERMPMFPDEEPIREYQRKPKQRIENAVQCHSLLS